VLERQNLFYEEYNNYVENLVSEYQKILWYRALWEEFMGGIYGRNLWEEFMGGNGVILYRLFQSHSIGSPQVY
jgi:hypothetical protein